MSAIFVRAKIATELKTLSTREQRPDSAISQLAIVLLRVLWRIQAEMSRDSHGNPSQPHCVFVSWLVFSCRRSTYLCIVCVGKIWA